MASQKDIANRIPITGALMLATLMNTLDSTIANVAMPHMQGSVSASADQIVWVLTSYIIATAIMTPLSGWLSQKIGRKTMFLASIAGFTLASILCGIATSLPELVIFRLLQGIAGASLMPLSQATMLDIYPQRMIPRVMSIWSAAVILGPIIGPTLGGWLTEDFSWRWVFYINVPIGILAFLGIWTFMDRDDGGRQRPFDFLGFGALVLFIGGFQLLVDRGPSQDWFDSREIWIETAICVAGLWVFVIQTITSKNPFFHRDLAKDGNFVGTTIFGMFVGVLLFSTSALLPSMMQTLLGYSALQAGVASMTRGLGSFIAFLAVPMLVARFGPRLVLLVGILLSSLALWRMGQFDLSITPGPIEMAGSPTPSWPRSTARRGRSWPPWPAASGRARASRSSRPC
jgi:DHA2 family multidrug resistance protein